MKKAFIFLAVLALLACEEKTDMALAQKGLPKINGKSYEFIEPALPSITEFLQNEEYRQAVETELARSIETLSEVKKVTVSLNKDTTATVIVKLHPNKELQERQIKDIQNLVASVVDELKTKRVSVLNELTEIEYVTMQDPRDGKTYKTFKIGEQIWMAENLNYEAKGSKCYNDSIKNCNKYGRLYEWKTAMKVCPNGWHLPSNTEWRIIMNIAGNEIDGKKFKAKSGWDNYQKKSGNGTDDYGFSALPGGHGNTGGDFYGVGKYGTWWNSVQGHASISYDRDYSYLIVDVFRDDNGNTYLYSVRCVRDFNFLY